MIATSRAAPTSNRDQTRDLRLETSESAIDNLRSEIAFTMRVSSVKLISLNVGRPRLVVYQGKTINTGIFKDPISGPLQLRTLNLDGDRQADLTVHGGPYKAVYAYPSEHYPFWRKELPGVDLAVGHVW